MMTSASYVCQGCGSVHSKWKGQCDGCRSWNTLVGQAVVGKSARKKSSSETEVIGFKPLAQAATQESPRLLTGLSEFDRVCGGGLIAGSVSLVAGDPGIGKSTLLLQVAARLSEQIPVLYISGEESSTQIHLRAARLGLQNSSVQVMSHNIIESILTSVAQQVIQDCPNRTIPAFLIIDSIQTMVSVTMTGACGTVTQVRECMDQLVTLAKSTGIAIVVVGHITKDGLIAGPKVLEHMVDTVLYFEGERSYPYRLLRVVKNRFGATDEIGIFDMTEAGLKEVLNPSSLFLSHRQQPIAGACVFAGMEGTRPLLMEIQALSTPSFLPSPRRAVVGWDPNRLSMVLAVLEARCQTSFSNKDVFLSVLGGMKITDPAADLCVAMALLSCLKKRPLIRELLAFGEIGLTGEISPAPYSEQRLKEARKHGFSEVCMPTIKTAASLITHTMNHVCDLQKWFQS